MWNVGRLCAALLLAIASVNGQGQYNCPPPWQEFMDKCINFLLTGLPEAAAAADCDKDGAALVSVDSVDKNQFIVGKLANFEKQGREWYTSGVQNATSADPNAFMWEGTGQQIVGQQFWLSDFYRNPTRGNRIVYHTDDGITWGWARSTESEAKPYICEIDRSDVYKIMGEDRTFGYGTLETDSLKWEYGPSFLQQPNETYYDTSGVEQFVALVCIANGNPQPSYTWYNTQLLVRSVINPAKDTRVTITNGRLVINNPNKDTDIGDYQCSASNKFGTIMSNTVLIKFGYLLDFPKSQRDPINAKPYQGVGIECYPPKSGYPVLMYTWFKGAIPNFVRTELKPYIFISNFGKLYFSYVTKDDQDNYYCQVSAPRATLTAATGKVSLPIPLRVSEDIASIREPEIASGFPAIFPSNPLLGDDVRIECFAWGVGTPQLDYNWIRVDGKGLPANSQIREQGRVLMFFNVQPINAGQYQCSATRRNGQTASKMVLLNVEASPYFTIPMKDQHLDEGQTATFRCYGDGIPAVTFTWLRNGTVLNVANLSPEDQARITVSSNVLTVASVKPADAGMYQCAVSNTHATRYDTAQLRVLSFAPTFIKYPLQANQYATEEGAVTIMCQPEAAPQATIEWQFNGSPLSVSSNPTDRITQFANGNLHFNSVSQSDQGVYTCVATNKYGTSESSGNLTVVVQTTITNPPRDLVVTVNKTAFMMCEASYYPVIDITYSWLHSQFPVEFFRLKTDGSSKVWIERDKYYMMGEGINRGSLYITATQFYHAGEYTCLAESTAVTVKAVATLQVVGPPSQTAGVYGVVLDPYSVQLYWTDGSINGHKIDFYVIESYNMNDKIWISAKQVNDQDEVNSRSTKLDGLQPWTSYMFRVRAANLIGIGEPSDPSPAYTTLAAAPTVPPSRVGGGGGKVGVLTITWDSVSRTEQMGDGFGYTVQWRKKGVKDEEWTTKDVPGADSNMYTALVGTVNYYKEYEVSVQCYNKIGRSPRSDIVTIRSSEDLPVAVAKNIHAIYFNATALQPEWDPVENTLDNIRGVLKGYRINYWAPDYYPDATWAQFKVILGETPRGIIIGLYPFTYYRVSIQVMNTAGFGPVSQEFSVKTLRNAPLTAPQELRANVSGWDSAIISWRGVNTGPMEEPLVGYVLRYWTQGENIFLAKDIDVGKKMHYRLEGLDQNIIYSVRVYGYSRGGAGTQSPTLEFLLGPSCEANEMSLDKDYIYVCGSCSLTSLSSLLLLLSLAAQSLMRLQLW